MTKLDGRIALAKTDVPVDTLTALLDGRNWRTGHKPRTGECCLSSCPRDMRISGEPRTRTLGQGHLARK